MELARSWFVSPIPVAPPEIADLLASHPRTAGVTLLEGVAEHVTPLPERGEGRNHDLLLSGRGPSGNVVVSIEAKVDESFGETVGRYWAKARTSGAPTKAPERIQALLTLMFGVSAHPGARAAAQRYGNWPLNLGGQDLPRPTGRIPYERW